MALYSNIAIHWVRGNGLCLGNRFDGELKRIDWNLSANYIDQLYGIPLSACKWKV